MAKKKSVQESVAKAGAEKRKKANKDIKRNVDYKKMNAEDEKWFTRQHQGAVLAGRILGETESDKALRENVRQQARKARKFKEGHATAEVEARSERKKASEGVYKAAKTGESMKAYAKKKEAPPKKPKKKPKKK